MTLTSKVALLLPSNSSRDLLFVFSLATSPHIVKEVASIGVSAHIGYQISVDSVNTALDEMDAIFLAILAEPIDEIAYASNLFQVAPRKNSQHLVYSCLVRVGEHGSFPN